MSLRTRLALLFTLVLGGTLLIFGSLVYGLVSVVLTEQVDSVLEREAARLIEGLGVNTMGQFDRRWLDAFEPAEGTLVIQVWDNNRRLQFARPRTWTQPLDPAARQSGRTMFSAALSNDQHMRVLTVPLVARRGPVGILQVGLSLALVDAVRSTLASILIFLSLISTFFSALLASVAVRRTLEPLEMVTEVATTITRADDLSRRIPTPPDSDDEVGRLIQAFNQTLSRLESLFTTQRRFIADVSHELRTPLTVIKGEVSLMRKMKCGDEESLQSIESEVDRLSRLVGNLLLLAQAESGRLPLDLKPVEMDTVLLEVFQQMRTLAGDRVRIEVNPLEQVSLIGDRDRLKQVLLNIVGNAVQYTPAGGVVTLGLTQSDGYARITVSDTGPGIPEEDLPYIFERFYRGEKSRTRSQGQASGFGLGLSIAYWIVQVHGGRIDVTSVVGKGTTFVIHLPLTQPQKSSDAPEGASRE